LPKTFKTITYCHSEPKPTPIVMRERSEASVFLCFCVMRERSEASVLVLYCITNKSGLPRLLTQTRNDGERK